MRIELKVPGNPTALKRHRSVRRGSFNVMYDPSEGDKADFLAKAMEVRPKVPFDCPLKVTLLFYFPRPKAHYRTGKYAGVLKPDAPFWHTKKPDIDNLTKFVFDALNGVYWRDDSIICWKETVKQYTDIVPRVEVITEEIGNLLFER